MHGVFVLKSIFDRFIVLLLQVFADLGIEFFKAQCELLLVTLPQKDGRQAGNDHGTAAAIGVQASVLWGCGSMDNIAELRPRDFTSMAKIKPLLNAKGLKARLRTPPLLSFSTIGLEWRSATLGHTLIR